MTTIPCVEIHTKDNRIFPTGHHGNVCRVGHNNVTAIECIDGVVMVSASKSPTSNGGDSGPVQFLLADWVYCRVAKASGANEFKCPVCSEVLKNSQGLGAHMLTHKGNNGPTSSEQPPESSGRKAGTNAVTA